MNPRRDPAPACRIIRSLPWPPAGRVFEGRLADEAEPVVLLKLSGHPDQIARVQRSLRMSHPTIPRNHALVPLEHGLALVQAWPRGCPLPELPEDARSKLRSPASLVDLLDQLLAGLEHAHSLGVTHGDLRADDLLLDGGRAQLRRFGLGETAASPRDDVQALAECLRPLLIEPRWRALLESSGDAGALRRRLRELQPELLSRDQTLAADATARRALPSPPLGDSTAEGARREPSEALARTEEHPSQPTSGSSRPRIGPEELVGRTLGDFVILSKMAQGGLGMVFRAEQRSLGREAVVKVPFRRGGSSDRTLPRFLNEAQLASRLDHPYAAHVYAFGSEPDGLVWIAMELVNGTALDEYLQVCGPMKPARAAAFVGRLAEVLHRAHELGIVHRDIKPANVMVLQRSGRLLPKLLDFGIARDLAAYRAPEPAPAGYPLPAIDAASSNPPGSLTIPGSVMGSPLYMAPEQWVDASQVGPAADIYSLGVLLFELLTGRSPFQGATVRQVAAAHASSPIPPLPPDLRGALDGVLTRALAKRSSERYATTLELAAALDAAVGGGEAAPLPQIDQAVRAGFLEEGPPPLAEALALLDAARNTHQARAAVDQVVDAAANWIGVLALAARSRRGPVDTERGRAIVREMCRRTLQPGEWMELARELTRAWASRPELHPIAELVELLAPGPGPLDQLLARRAVRLAGSNERLGRELAEDVALLESALGELAWTCSYRVVAARSGGAEVWSGVRRARPAARLAADVAAEGGVILVDKDGAAVLRLEPLVRLARAMPNGAEQLFVAVGGVVGGAGGARLVALPEGFEIAAPEVLAWVRATLLTADDAEAEGTDATQGPPYLGLSPFKPEDADRFFGRERERDAFLNRLRVQSLLAVVGRSGSGKSSFVLAGVIPHLPAGWRAVTMRPGATPAATLRARLDSVGAGTTLLLVDQFEELFTLCRDGEERERFARALATASRSAEMRVVLTLRDDFLSMTQELDGLRELIEPGLVLLAAPGPADLERIVAQPAQRRGYEFDDAELPRRMVREVADQPGALAMLSFTAAELWERRDRHFKRLLVRDYQAMGGVTGALVGHAEATLAALAGSERALVRHIFRRLVTAEGTRAVVGKRELVETLSDPARGTSTIEKLIASRLVVASEGDDGTDRVEVAHETLLQAWPRLVEWRREDQEGARLRDQLRDAARQWAQRGQARGLLWRDDALAEYRLWHKRHGGGLTATETAFAEASLAADRRAVRRRRTGIAVGFALLAAVSIILSTLNRRAERAVAETRQRLIDSYLEHARTELLGGRRWNALASLGAAQKMGASAPSIDLMRGLARAPARALERRLVANHGRTWSVGYSPDGKLLLTTGDDGAALWEVDTGRRRALLEGHQGSVRDGAFSPDGKHIATIGFDGTVRLWDATTGAARRVLTGHRGVVRCLSWRPDSAVLATTDDSGSVRVWNAVDGRSERGFDAGAKTTACSFARDRLAVGTWAGDVLLFEGGRVVKLGHHDDLVRAVSFSADGSRLVSASGDKTAVVWDAARRSRIAELRGAGDALLDVHFSPDGRRVVASARDGTARVFDAATGRLQLTLSGHKGVVWSAAFDRTGGRIVTSADDGSARVWDAERGLALAVLEGHDKLVIRACFSPDGAHVATASYDGTVALWSAAPAHFVAEVPGFPSPAVDFAMANTATRGVAMCGPDATRIWRPDAPREVIELPAAALVVASASRAVTVAERSTRARVWGLPSRQLELELEAGAPITAIAADESRIALADESGVVRLFDRQGRPQATVGERVSQVAFLDGDRWLTLSPDGTIRILAGERVEATLTGPGGSSWLDSSLELSPRHDLVALTGKSDLVLVRTTGRPGLTRLAGHQAPVLTARFDRSGGRVVTTSEDGTGGVWDVVAGRLLQRLAPREQYLADAEFDATDRLVLAVDGKGGLEFFDADGGQLLGTIDGAGRPGRTLARLADHGIEVIDIQAGLSTWRVEPDRDPLVDLSRDLACKAPSGQGGDACPP